MKPKDVKLFGKVAHKRGARKKPLKARWSNKKSKVHRLPPREFFRLPTRETLTYAEAQNLVDVDVGGELYRLNICDRLEIKLDDDGEYKKVLELEDESLSSTTANCRTFAATARTPPQLVIENLPKPVCRLATEPVEVKNDMKRKAVYYRSKEMPEEEHSEEIDYDLDEQDAEWLRLLNENRRRERLIALTVDDFEYVMDRLEKQSFQLSIAAAADNRQETRIPCAVCGDADYQPTNVIVVCDTCELRVHQDCYGVPYRPEGQWVCRKCLRAPGKDTECCLCPNRGGAMKQTTAGSWVHVVCALCVPEVKFMSSVHLEPISLERVPASRRSAMCCGCRKRFVGTCVQCQETGCRLTCHATCIATTGFYLKLEKMPANGSRTNFRKVVFCSSHRPVDVTTSIETGSLFNSAVMKDVSAVSCTASVGAATAATVDESSSSKHKNAKLELAPIVQPSFPISTVSQNWLTQLAEELCVRDKRRAVGFIYSYWLLKRVERRGLPLLQNLYLSMHRVLKAKNSSSDDMGKNGFSLLKKIRQNMEKVRLLLELIRKREKLKAEWLKYHEVTTDLRLKPMTLFLHRVLGQLQAKDVDEIFATPVPVDEVPDYLDKIKHPMDFSTMSQKIDVHAYQTMDDFNTDFQLIVSNCLSYNELDSPLYNVALKLRKQGNAIITTARRLFDSAHYNTSTGLHEHGGDSSAACESRQRDSVQVASESPEDTVRKSLTSELASLQQQLELSCSIKNRSNMCRVRLLKQRICQCRRQLTRNRMKGRKSGVDDIGKQTELIRSPLRNGNATLNQRVQNIIAADVKSESIDSHSSLSANCVENVELLNGERLSVDVTFINDALGKYPLKDSDSCDSNKSFDEVTIRNSQLHVRSVNGIKTADQLKSFSIHPKLNCRMAGGRCQVTRALLNQASSGLSSLEMKRSPGNAELLPVLKRLCVKGAEGVGEFAKKTTSRFHQLSSLVFKPASIENDSSVESAFSGASDLDCCQSTLALEKVEKRPSIHSSSEASMDFDQLQCHPSVTLLPADVVWAKTRGYPWYPAVIVSPNCAKSHARKCRRTSFVPPAEVLALRYKHTSGAIFLVRFFDKRRMWQWLPCDNLKPLGVDRGFDSSKIAEIKASKRSDIRRAYYEAIRNSRKSNGLIRNNKRFNGKLAN